jgi:hypothetical protein
MPTEQVARVIRARRGLRRGSHHLATVLRMPRSTIYDVLRRTGFSRLRDLDRVSAVPIRYVRERPGELLHVDTKKLARIPPGGGRRVLDREVGRKTKTPKIGYDYLHVHVDDASRAAVVVMTDRSPVYTWWPAFSIRTPWSANQAAAWRRAWAQLLGFSSGIPAERFIKTLLNEWA